MRQLTYEDLDDLALGAALLGSGGGGDPLYDLMMAKHALEEHGSLELIELDDLEDDALIVPVAFAGAPLVGQEKLPSGNEVRSILMHIEKIMGKRPSALMPAEIGGGNAFAPFYTSAEMGIPILDADTLGRAFPELHMSSCNLMGISASPAFVADHAGNVAVLYAKSARDIEIHARALTVAMGSSAGCALYLMTKKEAEKGVVKGSISKAIALGKALKDKRSLNTPPLFSGCIVHVEQEIKNGFLQGSVLIRSGEDVQIYYQNEYLAAYKGSVRIAETPDILILLEQESKTPITTEMLRYGLKVDLFVLPSPSIWKTEKGLELVGPKYFGYV